MTAETMTTEAQAEPALDWREEYAYTLGIQAYVFGFPWVYLPLIRWLWVTQQKNPERVPYAPLNRFWHSRELTDASYRDGGSPNNDTLYSMAWIDLRREPVVLSVPEVCDRYYTMELAGMDSDNFAYVGTRTTGGGAGSYAILGPDWHGELPDGVQPLERARTPFVPLFGRTLVTGPDDLPAVHALQDAYTLTPLSRWGQSTEDLPEDRAVPPPFDPQADPLADWRTMNQAMTENPPEARHAPLLRQFAQLGVGPSCTLDETDEATKRGLARAAVAGRALLHQAGTSGDLGRKVNGWTFPPQVMGRAGVHDDFLTRAAVQCLMGIIANDPEEAVYLNTSTDSDGEPLRGDHRYQLRFGPGELPEVKAFWSVTMYGMDTNLVDNPVDRYALGDRSPGLIHDADGSLTFHIQAEAPDPSREPNWLPTPAGQPFYLVLRTYLPAAGIVEQTWAPPALQRVS
jgi:hypothetical protein